MSKINVLIIGRHQQILDTLCRLVNKTEYFVGYAALTDYLAFNLFAQHKIDLVLLSSGIDEKSEFELRNQFINANPTVKIIQHYGGGSGLLYNELMEVFDN